MPRRDWRLRVQDILTAADRIHRFVTGLTFETFATDDKAVAAVCDELLIIGEGATHLPEAVRGQSPEIPSVDVCGMRNIVAHHYFGIDLRLIWETATHDVPALEHPMKALVG